MMNKLLTKPDETLEQGQRVSFEIADLKGRGKIVGVATNGSPLIGRSYIIEPDQPISNEVYNYTHFVAFESQMSLENV